MSAPVLAGDIGGTNSRLAIYDGDSEILQRTYPSGDFQDLAPIVARFLDEAGLRPAHACLGVAGPVEDDVSRTTNLPWVIDARRLEAQTGVGRVHLVNDFHAAAIGVTGLGDEHLVLLGGQPRVAHGPMAVVGAGTGLGQAFLFWSRTDREYKVVSSEGGHADFAPRTPLELGLHAFLTARYGHVSNERVVSGPGLVDMFGFLSAEPACRPLVALGTLADMEREAPAAVITRRGMDSSDPLCRMALLLFAGALGALAGNLALAFLTTGGVFVAGGVAQRIAPFLQAHAFREAFEAKGRFTPVAARLPAFVVTHPEVGLKGAAHIAARM